MHAWIMSIICNGINTEKPKTLRNIPSHWLIYTFKLLIVLALSEKRCYLNNENYVHQNGDNY